MAIATILAIIIAQVYKLIIKFTQVSSYIAIAISLYSSQFSIVFTLLKRVDMGLQQEDQQFQAHSSLEVKVGASPYSAASS